MARGQIRVKPLPAFSAAPPDIATGDASAASSSHGELAFGAICGPLGEVRRKSAASGSFDRSDVNLLHAHHRFESPFCFIPSGCQRVRQDARRNLPGHAPFVFAPPARTLLSATLDDSVPVAVGLLLIVGGDLK